MVVAENVVRFPRAIDAALLSTTSSHRWTYLEPFDNDGYLESTSDQVRKSVPSEEEEGIKRAVPESLTVVLLEGK